MRPPKMNSINFIGARYLSQAGIPSASTEIQITDSNLSGELNITSEKFPNLEVLNCSSTSIHAGLSNVFKIIKIKNLPKLKEINANCCLAQDLIIENCPEITVLKIRENRISSLGFLSNLNPEKLTYLEIASNNKISECDLSIFGEMTNLETLNVGNNNFSGSLEKLKKLTKLKELNISYTNINSGLESLPNSVARVCCSSVSSDPNKTFGCKAIEEKLKNKEGVFLVEDENDPYFNLKSKGTVRESFVNFLNECEEGTPRQLVKEVVAQELGLSIVLEQPTETNFGEQQEGQEDRNERMYLLERSKFRVTAVALVITIISTIAVPLLVKFVPKN